jgi:hypothetical protein
LRHGTGVRNPHGKTGRRPSGCSPAGAVASCQSRSRIPAGPDPSGSLAWNMGQPPALRKRRLVQNPALQTGPIPDPAIPSRLTNSSRFDKTKPAPVQQLLSIGTTRRGLRGLPRLSTQFSQK